MQGARINFSECSDNGIGYCFCKDLEEKFGWQFFDQS